MIQWQTPPDFDRRLCAEFGLGSYSEMEARERAPDEQAADEGPTDGLAWYVVTRYPGDDEGYYKRGRLLTPEERETVYHFTAEQLHAEIEALANATRLGAAVLRAVRAEMKS